MNEQKIQTKNSNFYHYHLYLTSQCNQNCLFCLVKDKPDPRLTFRQIKKLLKRIKKKGVQHISIDGGEPTLYKNFIPLLREIKKLQFKTVHLKTNGVKFSEKLFVKQFFQLQQSSSITIFLSLHSDQADIHDYLTDRKGSFRQSIKAIENIVQNHYRLIINCVVCKVNYQELNEFIQLLKGFGITEINLLFIAPLGNALRNTFLIPDLKDIVPYIEEAIQYADSKQIYVSLTFFPFCIFTKNYYPTHAVEFNLFDSTSVPDELSKERYKSAQCRKCKYYYKCPGIWKEYYKLYGFKFKPIK